MKRTEELDSMVPHCHYTLLPRMLSLLEVCLKRLQASLGRYANICRYVILGAI